MSGQGGGLRQRHPVPVIGSGAAGIEGLGEVGAQLPPALEPGLRAAACTTTDPREKR
jgi:hypothetical protein